MNQHEAVQFIQNMYNSVWHPLDVEIFSKFYSSNVKGHSGETHINFNDIQKHINNLKNKYAQLNPDFHRILCAGNQITAWFTQHAIDYNGDEVMALETMVTYEVRDNQIQQFWFMWDVNASDFFNESTHPEKFQKQDNQLNKQNLTGRERDTLYYLIRHFNQKEIARALDLSPRTIESYIDSLKSKFNVNSKNGLIDIAIQNGYALPVEGLFELALKHKLIDPL
jgi:DNA-binding CsgD family transcriptional regulator